MMATLERNSWKDTLRELTCRTWLGRKDGSCFFTLTVVPNFLPGDVGHAWMGSRPVLFYAGFSMYSCRTRWVGNAHLQKTQGYGPGTQIASYIFDHEYLRFFADLKQGPPREFSGKWQFSKYWLC